jgi:L-ascorbate metabolism protein UlaG (beta-lactamase superfamily)
MKITYLGHSSVLITTQRGSRIVIDPYKFKVNREFPKVIADVVLVSHEHPDHNAAFLVQGNPIVLKRKTDYLSSFEIKTPAGELIEFLAVPTFHDNIGGKKLGPNTVWVFNVDRFRIAHFGDIGHTLKENQVKEIGMIDIMIAPIGGGEYTISSKEFFIIMEQVKAIVSIPIHFKTSFTPWIKESLDSIVFPGKEELNNYFISLFSLPTLPKVYVFPEEVWRSLPEEISEDNK